MMRWLLLLAIAAWSAATMASEQVPPPPQRRALVLINAVLHTVSGPVIASGRMRVEGGRITAIAGPGQPFEIPAGAQVVDLGGGNVYPGFIAANSAVGLTEVPMVRATVDVAETGFINPNARAVVALNADSEIIPVTRSNGVLAVLAVPAAGPGGGIAGTSALVQLDGWNWEEMALERELALHVEPPSMRLASALLPPPLDVHQAELRRFRAQRLRAIEDAFDAAAAYASARAADAATPSDMRFEAMRAALEGRRPVFVHADELPQMRWALALAERHRLRLVIVGGADAARIAGVLAERRVPVVIGGVHRLPLRRGDDVDAPFRLAAELARAGVPFCIARGGGAWGAANERNLPYEAATAAAHGLPRDEALRSITLYPAQILGVADRLGSIEVGRLANFIVTDGDPLETTTIVKRIFIQGREIDAGNRQRRLTEKYLQRPAERSRGDDRVD